uniref:RNA helicase n=1 Tax=Tetranychus urticae TaxID=32264 RepID=T1K006_TETUR
MESKEETLYPNNQIARKLDPADVCINEVLFENIRFAHLNLDQRLLKGLARSGFKKLSTIQKESVPLGRIGVDMVLHARSGTGKTCAYTLIALDSLLSSDNTQVLIVTPTREIALQVSEVVKTIGTYIENLKIALVTGGFKVQRDKDSLQNAQIVIGTLGRLIQLIEFKYLPTSSIRLLILDEADKLFEDQLREQLSALLAHMPEARQTIAVSATFPPNMKVFIEKFLKDPQIIKTNENVQFPAKNAQFYAVVPDRMHLSHKIKLIKKWIDNLTFDQLIIFVNTKESGQKIADDFREKKKYRCMYLFGDLPQTERFDIFKKFHGSKYNILVTTDLFSRGIDCHNVNMVINVDLPIDEETFLHRIGRAGRFGMSCLTLTLVKSGPEELIYDELSKSLNFEKHKMPEDLKTNNPWGVLDERYRTVELTDWQKLDRMINSHRFRPPCRRRRACPSFHEKDLHAPLPECHIVEKTPEESAKAFEEEEKKKIEFIRKHGRLPRANFMKRLGMHYRKYPGLIITVENMNRPEEFEEIIEKAKGKPVEFWSSTDDSDEEKVEKMPAGGWPGCCGGHIMPGTPRWFSLDEHGQPIKHQVRTQKLINIEDKEVKLNEVETILASFNKSSQSRK